MDVLIKAAAGVLIAVLLGMALSKQGKECALLLTVAVCCMVVASAVSYLQPVIDFFERLQSLGNLDPEMLRILLKAVGIGILAEVIELICADAGNATLGKALQILATAGILWISIPLLDQLLELIEKILGAI